MRPNSIPVQSIDEYISRQSELFKSTLEEMRAIVHAAAPKAEETISYMIPTFRLHYALVGIGVNKKYCSFYLMSTALAKEMKAEFKGIKGTGTTLHFVPGEKLPVTLLKKIVKARIKENEVRLLTKKK